MEKILLPVDGSEESLKAVEYAVALASNTGARVDLVHVVPTEIALTGLVPDGFCVQMDRLERACEEQGRKILNMFARKSSKGNVEVTTRLEKGPASKIILRLARMGCYKMIIMGKKKSGPLARALFGSICRDVVEKAPCPVLVVH